MEQILHPVHFLSNCHVAGTQLMDYHPCAVSTSEVAAIGFHIVLEDLIIYW